MSSMRRVLSWLVPLAVVAGLAAAVWLTRGTWQPLLESIRKPKAVKKEEDHAPHGDRVKITPQARKNLGIKSLLVTPRKEYWRKVQIPGVIVDRPGVSDSGVTAPITGVVTVIHAVPGDTVKPGDPLVTLRLTSEYLHNTQSELSKLAKESEVNKEQIKRLEKAVKAGLAEARVIEARNQQKKVEAQIQANRQILQTHGLKPEQIDQAAEGKFVRSLSVPAPQPRARAAPLSDAPSSPDNAAAAAAYEIKELKVQLGDQVQAGQALAVLANHRLLFIEGRGFKGEAPLIARAAEKGWPVEAEFAEDDPGEWGKFDQKLSILNLANAMDPASRTFGFYVPLTNPSRTYTRGEKTYLLWRFRPGQRVRLLVPVEKVENKVVLPAGAVVRDGEETYVFRVNGDAFDRKPVTVVYEDRHNVILDDADAPVGLYVADSSAAALNRVLKAQLAGEGGGAHAGHSH